MDNKYYDYLFGKEKTTSIYPSHETKNKSNWVIYSFNTLSSLAYVSNGIIILLKTNKLYLIKRLQPNNRLLILDSFCGTGMSTALIAEANPDALVVGIDQSAHRLAKHQAAGAQNYLLLRAEAEPFWLCLVEAGITLHSHWLLYPNPWPKASQFKRRVHGHGAFPVLSRLGGKLELRTNWDIFAQEFAQAAALIGIKGHTTSFTSDSPMSLFERKYADRGHTLWRFRGECVI